uniref:G-protein coupled receptors family 1 profile domain-containing protein n=1 Tax=Varanus komodoensis TaxID=61221 RepID=A0A8D2IUL8_VARKO
SDTEANKSGVTEFILLGFSGSPCFQLFIFILFFIMYSLTILGNFSIILLIITHYCFHVPMYFFLCNLSFLEIWYTTASIPKILAIFLGRSRSVSFMGCMLQMYFIFSFGCTEHFLIAVMAYNQYLAICYPLHYSTFMDVSLCSKLALACWLGGLLIIFIPAYMITRLSFCGHNVINNFYCNMNSWIALSCTDTHFLEITAFFIAIIVIVGSCVITLLSYVYIVSTILHIPSKKGQQKAFSTCSFHLAVVIIWYGSTIFLFVKTFRQTSFERSKVVSIFNLIVVPLLNPFIYTLRNKEVREVLRNALHK